jgi:hypothetical protein
MTGFGSTGFVQGKFWRPNSVFAAIEASETPLLFTAGQFIFRVSLMF